MKTPRGGLESIGNSTPENFGETLHKVQEQINTFLPTKALKKYSDVEIQVGDGYTAGEIAALTKLTTSVVEDEEKNRRFALCTFSRVERAVSTLVPLT